MTLTESALRLTRLVPILCSFATANAVTTNLVPVADTGLFQQNPDNNLGGMTYVNAGTIRQANASRALFKFNIAAALPANATVTSASLLLPVPTAKGAGQDFELHRVLKDWGEGTGSGGGGGTASQGAPAQTGEATWNARFHPSTLWGAPGGQAGSDYVAAASATAAMGATLPFASPGMAADVQAWLDTPGTNFGWMLIEANETLSGTASHISSREDLANAPVLTVEYTLPSPPTPPTLVKAAQIGNNISLMFGAEANRTYAVEYIGALPGTNWTVLTNLAASPTPTDFAVSDPLTGSNRFYRVRTP